MSSIAQQESLVKESLFQFVTKNIPSADLNVIDEIVLSYVISILEEASQDPCFDVEGFVEMMSAYFPEFSDIDQAAVCSWIFELEAEINGGAHGVTNDVESYADKLSLSLSEMLPPVSQKGNRSHSSSESSDSTGRGRRSWSDCGQESSLSELCFPEECQLVAEMFPNICLMEIKTCMIIANGDIHLATQILLHRQENGQSLSNSAALLNMTVGANRNQQIDDAELKNRIIARYSYVDKNSDTKEHKPLAPRIEPKKLVRYRDNKIVSLKGERYTEVPKSGADEDQLKKPKKQHCP